MAIWKDPTPAPKADPIRFDSTPSIPEPKPAPTLAPSPAPTPARSMETPARESVIAADLTIEGKIEGAGHIRIAGKFKGDVNVTGNLTIEPNASLTGQVNAKAIIIAGELNGNILGADKVELLESGVVNGDIKTGTLTVAAGSRMRGQVDFGWKDKG